MTGKNEVWNDIVTPMKVVAFIQNYAIPRPGKNRLGGPPRGHSGIKADVSGLVDLHNDQVSKRPLEVMNTPGADQPPRNGNSVLSNIMAVHLRKEKNEELANPGNSGRELCDGEQYSDDQHRQVCEYGLSESASLFCMKRSQILANSCLSDDQFHKNPFCLRARVTNKRHYLPTSTMANDQLPAAAEGISSQSLRNIV